MVWSVCAVAALLAALGLLLMPRVPPPRPLTAPTQVRECRIGTLETPGRAPGTLTDAGAGGPHRTGRVRTAVQRQHEWVDLQIKQAMERGEFDNLPGAGKPIKNLGTQHDPDWWIKQLIGREKITGVLPPPCNCARTTPSSRTASTGTRPSPRYAGSSRSSTRGC